MGAPEMAAADEAALVEALLQGDERAFEWLVQQHHTTLVRLALRYVRDPAIAEEVAQETWLHVLKGLPRFQLRSSLKTWMTQILMNRARTRARRDRRSLPFTDTWLATLADGEPAVDQDRFVPLRVPQTLTGGRRHLARSHLRSASSQRKRRRSSSALLRLCLLHSARSSPCGILRVGLQSKCATLWD